METPSHTRTDGLCCEVAIVGCKWLDLAEIGQKWRSQVCLLDRRGQSRLDLAVSDVFWLFFAFESLKRLPPIFLPVQPPLKHVFRALPDLWVV